MRLSEKGVEFIAEHEGFVGHTYDDKDPQAQPTYMFKNKAMREDGTPVTGKLTLGYGETRTDLAQPGVTISEEEAKVLLRHRAQSAFGYYVNKLVKANVNQNQFDALVSFAYNLGVGALRDSTLLRKLNAGAPKEEVAKEFMRWVYWDGKVSRGLQKRRKAEATLFLSD